MAESRTAASVQVVYDDRITRMFVWATLIWGVVGMLVGAIAALQLAWWPANADTSWFTFGRLRPLHTNAVVFAFTGNAIFAGMYYSMQRLLRTRMWSDKLSAINFWGWQAIIVAAAITLPMGLTQTKEYAELEWPIDIAITIVWVAMTINVFGTIATRRVKHLYVAIWFYLGSILTIAVLHIVNNLSIPVSAGKSYSIFAGVQDALVQWWYGHNAVGFLLTTPILGLMYYFVPKACDRPVYSYRLSIVHFWSLVFLYIWAGPHHLLYTSLPDWAQSLGMVFSIMLIAPSWGGMLNGLLTIRGSWHKVRTDPILKFFVVALTFYGMATLEGPLMSIKSFNKLTHYTEWTVAHVHGGALGWVGGMIFGMVYWLVPKLWNRPMYSQKLVNTHFWFATIGMLLYITSMWAAGLTQYVMWFARSADGLLKYPNFMESVLAIKPLYWVRLTGGTLYLTGAIMCLYNVWRTACLGTVSNEERTVVPEIGQVKPKTFHEWLELRTVPMAVLTVIVISIGGLIEFLPTFFIESNVPVISTVKPYTPLQLEGRDVYIREGCNNCHSQMVRTLAEETQRYGARSESGEFIYDYPHLWGSKRTGPDLHRLGGKYPDFWHYRHMLDPRSTSPGSIMPAYPWLKDAKVDFTGLQAKMRALKTLGVPYADDLVKDPMPVVNEESKKIADGLAAQGVQIAPDSELVALIAYLQRLGVDIKQSPETAQN